MAYCTQSTPFQASEKQGTAFGLEIGQPSKFVETLGVLWFQSPKMARNAFTAAEDTIKHYSHVCGNILEHFEKKFHIYKLLDWTHHQILTIEKTNSWSMYIYIYILKLINVGCVISLLRNLQSLSR
jgi:hypothetical protein